MNKPRKVSLVMSAVLVSFVILVVTASSLASSTPLYTVRMEQASSQMHFLPTAVTEFTYTAAPGVELNYTVMESNSIRGPNTQGTCLTCLIETCQGDPTCESTCEFTCDPHCLTSPTKPCK
jgi:hypothetical protein